ncbi:MAG TPA: ABC transporter ATP-binding protein [Mucilaginibacter sp.]|nr:ABC transporter ATP-binding protein [Mucilaginibacter sp.]
MIKADNLSKHFGTIKAVDGISFGVGEHEALILLGTSGCGKTTTLKMINRLIEPTSGRILLNGKDIANEQLELLRRSIGYVLQNNGLFPHYTVAENIAIVPQLLKWDGKRIENRISELIEKLHLSHGQLTAYPHELSGGQQQRVGLARALVADPPVLLMDEPFGALDNITRSKIHAEFKALDELKRKTIIMVTHDVQEAFELGDRICLMDKGKIVQIGTPAELLFRPVNDFVKEFLKEQRLRLELKAIKIEDLWEWLPIDTNSTSDPLPAATDVWTVLEHFSTQHSAHLQSLKGQETRSVKIDALMSAYYQYQNSRAHE